MPVTCWLQHADFASEDRGAVALDGAITVLNAVDWPSELDAMRQREARGEEFCPPGVGFVSDDGRIPHICPTGGEATLCHYHFPAAGGFLRWLLGKKHVSNGSST
jgi:hypothetical protein